MNTLAMILRQLTCRLFPCGFLTNGGIRFIFVLVLFLLSTSMTTLAANNTWTGSGPFATGIGNKVITAVIVDPTNPNIIYAGTGSGTVFQYRLVTKPGVTTTAASDMTSTTAALGGDVTSDGGDTVTDRGTCYGTNENPAPGDPLPTICAANGSGTGTFSSPVSGLTQNTLYHTRAYAINSEGTGFGDDLTFSTLATQTLTITKAGTGDGTIGIATGAIACGAINWAGKSGTASCDNGAEVTLTASADSQSVLNANTWSGDCNGNNPCGPISMTVDHSVTATFDSKANFTWHLFPGFVVSFTDTSINPPSSWQWSFGDTAASSAQNPAHTYAGTGDYSVTLQAGWPAGSASITKTVSVAGCSNPATHVAGGLIYGTLFDTYTAVTPEGTIELQATEVGAAPEFADQKPFTLYGGFDCNYAVSNSYSTINGPLTMKGGAVTIEYVIIK